MTVSELREAIHMAHVHIETGRPTDGVAEALIEIAAHAQQMANDLHNLRQDYEQAQTRVDELQRRLNGIS
jgi:hypothetical protein